MDTKSLEDYLHEHIPISKMVQVSVTEADQNKVILSTPLPPNINHMGTAFGGSESMLAILAAWSLLHVRLENVGFPCTIIIQRHSIDYELPVPKKFIAKSHITHTEAWPRFMRTLESHGRARINISASIEYEHYQAATFEGDFVAIKANKMPAQIG